MNRQKMFQCGFAMNRQKMFQCGFLVGSMTPKQVANTLRRIAALIEEGSDCGALTDLPDYFGKNEVVGSWTLDAPSEEPAP